MTSVPVMPREGEWTVEDLLGLPDDGLQYELADGVLLVTPGPRVGHQRVVRELTLLLSPAMPPELELLFAPFDYQPSETTSLQPDLLIVRREDVEETRITAPLVLAVEVLSPSTRAKDLMLKFGLYAASGVAHYWVVDPDEPSVTTWQLVDGQYVETGHAVGEGLLRVKDPFSTEIRPDLLGR